MPQKTQQQQVRINEQLHRAVKVEAARQDRPIYDCLNEAVRNWLQRQEQAHHEQSSR